MSGDLTFEMDHVEGFIRVFGTGIWTPEQASVHFVQLRQAVEGLRAIRQPVLVLVDLTAADLQPTAVAEAVRHGTARVYRDADFVAVVVASILLGIQMKRASSARNVALFGEVTQALDWLAQRRVEMRV